MPNRLASLSVMGTERSIVPVGRGVVMVSLAGLAHGALGSWPAPASREPATRNHRLDLAVRGTGCARRVRLEANATAAAEAKGLACQMARITDGDSTTDARIVVSRKVPAAAEIAALLPSA